MHTDRQDFRARVVSAARELFILKGYEETSMSDVGKALSVSKPTIYECFASKQALMEAVVESAVATLDMTLTRAAARGDVSFEEYINRMPEECTAMALDRNRSAMYRLLIQEGASNMEACPWLLAFPGAFFVTTLLSLNLLGDALRDALDPKSLQ